MMEYCYLVVIQAGPPSEQAGVGHVLKEGAVNTCIHTWTHDEVRFCHGRSVRGLAPYELI